MLSRKTTNQILHILRDRIKKKRLSMNTTQVELAQQAGVSYATLRKLENTGKGSIELLIKVAIALGCIDQLDEFIVTYDGIRPMEYIRIMKKRKTRIRASAK